MYCIKLYDCVCDVTTLDSILLATFNIVKEMVIK